MAAINIKTLGRSSITGGLAQLWRVLSRFILTPVIINELGMSGYGVWTLVFSIAAYVDMSNVSLGLAYTKFTAECVRKRRFDELSRIIGSGIALVTPIGVAGVLVAAIWGESILGRLNVPTELLSDATWALVVIIAMMLLRMTVGCRLEILAGLQRIDLTFRLYVIASIIEFAASLPLLLMGYGLLGLAIGHAVGQIAINVAAYWMVRSRLPEVRISPFHASRDGLRKILSVGGRFQVLSVVNTVVLQGVKMMLSWLMGVEWVAIYELAHKLIQLGRTASGAIIAPLMPAFASLRAGGDRLREQLLFFSGSKANTFFAWTAFSFIAVLAPTILLMWTGKDQPEAAWALRVLAVGESLALLTAIVSSSLRAQGLVGLEFKQAMINTGVFAALILFLGPLLEFEGLIYSRLIAQTLGSFWYLRAYFRFMDMSWKAYITSTRLPVLAGIILALSAMVLVGRQILPPVLPPDFNPRWRAVIEVLAWSVPFVGALFAATWKLYLTPSDRAQITVLGTAVLARMRGQSTYVPPEVIVVSGADLDATEALVEAAEALGTVESLTVQATGALLSTGLEVRLVLVLLGPNGDPAEAWSWVDANRPDLLSKLAFISQEVHSLYAEQNLRHYATSPDSNRLRADWPMATADSDADDE